MKNCSLFCENGSNKLCSRRVLGTLLLVFACVALWFDRPSDTVAIIASIGGSLIGLTTFDLFKK